MLEEEDLENLRNRYKNNLQGVVRLGLNSQQVSDMITSLNPLPDAYVVCTEDVGKPTVHTHFMIQSTSKKINIRNVRSQFKDWVENNIENESTDIESKIKKPQIYKNGDLNISRVKDVVRMLIYLSKQHQPDFVHNYPVGAIEELSKLSFEKAVCMTKAISLLKEKVYLKQITVSEYILLYRQCRNAYKKPDPNWAKEFNRMYEMIKSEDTMKEEIQRHLEIQESGYS